MTSFAWYPQQARWRYCLAAFVLALATIFWLAQNGEPELVPRLIALVFAFVAAFSLIKHDTHVDADARNIIREGRLFGCLRVWHRRHPLGEFSGVAMRRHIDPEGQDTVFVGLRRHNGRFMAVRYFYVATNQPSREAERLAQELAKTTGLKLHEDVD